MTLVTFSACREAVMVLLPSVGEGDKAKGELAGGVGG